MTTPSDADHADALRSMVAVISGTRSIGDSDLSEWLRVTQADLRRIAHRARAGASGLETLSTTALISETYLRFAESDSRFTDRRHFLATAARAMRQILLDYARLHLAQKRGGGAAHDPLEAAAEIAAAHPLAEELLELDAALGRLAEVLPRAARVVELRYFGGLDDREVGEVLGVEQSTVRRDWLKARAWLLMHLETAS
ncbi:MAG: sigma-70 family RNA polymerase sigma factor [Xanthomonadales bacterium]|nr:sigma-70 family RNA polymerase sigma factor [Xanthomonadales bacterium]